MSVQRALRRRIPSRRRRTSIGERRGSEYMQGLETSAVHVRSSPNCRPFKRKDTSTRRPLQISTRASVRSTRRWSGFGRPTTTAHRIWSTRRSAADSIRASPPMPTSAQSWLKWHFRLRLSKAGATAPRCRGTRMDLRTADSLCTPKRPVCKTSLNPVR